MSQCLTLSEWNRLPNLGLKNMMVWRKHEGVFFTMDPFET